MKTPLGLLLMLPLVVLAANVQSKETGTIILKSGEKYENVEYRIDKTYDVVKVDLVGTTRNFSFHQIDAILDSNGNDITLDALGTVGARSRETWNSEQDEVVKQARARLWDASISLGGRFTIPVGSYYEGIKSGIGFGGDVAFTLTHNVALRFMVHRTGLTVDDTYGLVSLDSNIVILSQNWDMSAWRYQIAGQYYGFFDREKKDRSMYYVYTGFGALSHQSTIEVTKRDVISGLVYTDKADDTQTKFTTSFGVGLIKMLSPRWGIDAGLHFDVVYLGRDSDDGDPNVSYYSFSGGAYGFDLHIAVVALL